MRVRVLLTALLTFLLLILSNQTFPQNNISEKMQFNRLTHQEGFPARNIIAMHQDSKGFLWMAAPDRLIRFDGKRQKLFRYSSSNEKSIGSNTIRFIYEDKSGVLWFATAGGGLNKYNSSQENFIRYTHNRNDLNSISSDDVSSICEDSYSNLWVGTIGGGLNKFDRKTEKFIAYKNDPTNIQSLSNNNVSVIYLDSRNNLWVGTTGGGLNQFDIKSKNFTRFIHNPSSQNSLSNDNVTGIIEDRNGVLLVSTLGGGLNKLTFDIDHQNPVFVHYKNNPKDSHSLSSNNISFLYLDRENIIWIGTSDDGINKMVQNPLNKSSVVFISYKNDKFDIFSLIDNNVNCIYEDNSGMLWVSTGGAGLHVFDKKQKQFKLYANEPNNKYSLSFTAVMSVYEDREGTRWIGTRDGGLNKIEEVSNKFIHYKHSKTDPNSLSDNNISAIYEDKRGILWVGTSNGGLNKFDRKTEKFFNYKHDPSNPKSISDNRILTITEDNSGKLWIGTSFGGLNQFNRDDETFIHYRFDPDDPNSISSEYVSELYCDITGKLLVATKEGLDEFDQKNKKFFHFNLNENSSDKNKHTRITALYEQKNGILWIGTFDRGLIKYQREQGIIKTYTTQDGLPIDYITGIIDDDHGNLWVSTTIGVTKFDPNKETMRTYIYQDGIQGVSERKPAKSKTGELIFGGAVGLSIFHPDSIKDFTHIPPVYFTDLYLFNKQVQIGFDSLRNRTILNKSLIETDVLILNYEDNVMSFDFAIIDFHSIFKWNRFAYKLEGFNKDWIYSETSRSVNNRSVTYTNLNPGEYTLKVKAANSDDIWNEDYASLKIIILPPWYRTIWAYLMYFILIGSIIYFTWKSQLKRIRVKQEVEMSKFETQKLHEIDEMKSRFFTNISHEFRTPLTLILGPVKEMIERTNDSRSKEDLNLVHRNAKRLLNLVNQLLDISKLESGSMNLHTVPTNLVILLKALTLSFTSYAERKRIQLNFTSDSNEIIAYIDKDKMEKIFTNVMSNAFKFTPDGGKIKVAIKCQAELVSASSMKPENLKHNEIPKQTRLPARQARDDQYRFVEISIHDTGIGISRDKLPKIFDRFYQVDSSHTRENEGTGIGLSLTKELVELHKGTIEVESEEGRGTVVTVRIPLGKAHLKTEEIFENEIEHLSEKPFTQIEEVYADEEGIKSDKEFTELQSLPLLLIVEDNTDVRNYIKNILQKEYAIVQAKDGDDGWKKSVEQIPDLIISDIMMPKMDGFRLCDKLKTDERTSHIPVILLTAKATKHDKIDGFELGADDYIMKPFETDELTARVKNLITQRKRLHEHFKNTGLLDFENTQITSVDKKFLQKTLEIIKQHISDTAFNVEALSEYLSVSKSVLQKKISALTGHTPIEFIRRIRLKKAVELIEKKFGNMSEIALEAGFGNPAYFSEMFKKEFGMTPKEYQQKIKNN